MKIVKIRNYDKSRYSIRRWSWKVWDYLYLFYFPNIDSYAWSFNNKTDRNINFWFDTEDDAKKHYLRWKNGDYNPNNELIIIGDFNG